jgi:PIN domain nuclease of toxin-antitoxin system
LKLLLDTHAFLWMGDDEAGRVSDAAVEAVADIGNQLFLSVASIWEMQIKVASGKLKLNRPLKEMVLDHRDSNGVEILAIRSRHVFMLDWIPDHHRDPFDRMLIAQAARDDLTLVTCDPQIARYPVTTLW